MYYCALSLGVLEHIPQRNFKRYHFIISIELAIFRAHQTISKLDNRTNFSGYMFSFI